MGGYTGALVRSENTSGDVTSSVLVIQPLLRAVAKAGVNLDEMLAAVGLQRETVQDRDGKISVDSMVELWRIASQMTGDPALSIHAAEAIEPGAFGVIDYVARCSSTLGEGIERSCRYYPLIHDAARPTLERHEGYCVWSYELVGGMHYPRLVAEYALACWLVICRQGIRGEFNPLEVHFTHNQNVNMQEYQRFFRAPVKLGASRNSLVLDSKALDWTLTGAKAGLFEILDRHAQQLLDRLPKTKRFSHKVRELIAAELAGGNPSEEGIAQRLKMSPRTLRRRLKDEGVSHRHVIEELRRDLATLYLDEKGLAIGEVAFLLGFAEASAFHRAFKRWVGQTPADYRRSQRQ